MNPVITKMEHFVIIVNDFKSFAIVAKSSILNVVGFLNSVISLLQKQKAGSSLK